MLKSMFLSVFKKSVPFYVLVCLCLLNQNPVSADIIYLNNGEEYIGTLVRIKKDKAYFKIKGKTKKWKTDEIQRIEFEELQQVQQVKELNDPLLDSFCKYGAGKTEYPDAASITLYKKTTYHVNSDSSWTKTTRIIRKVLSPRGRGIANQSFFYLSKSENLNLKSARVINPDGTINWLREAAKKNESIWTKFPEYESQRQIRFALPEILPGGISDICLEQTFPKFSIEYPLLIDECFREQEPIEYKIVEVSVPAGMELAIFKSEQIKSDKNSKSERTVYKFWDTKTKSIKKESWLPPTKDFSNRVVIGIQDNWEVIGKKYYDLIDSIFVGMSKTSPLQKKIKELKTANEIYEFVSTEIRAIPITSLEQYSWVPTSPDLIFKNKLGSLPDRVFLLYAMLRKAGFNVSLIMTSSHTYGKRIQEVPTLAQFPCFIIEIKENGKSKWLCPIDDKTAYGELPPEYQGRIGLRLKCKSVIVYIPVFEPEKECVKREVIAKLFSDGSLNVIETTELFGNFARNFRQRKALKLDAIKKYFEGLVSSIHPNAKLGTFVISDLENLSEPVMYKLDYKITDYALKSGDKFLVFNLPGINYTASEVGNKERENPLDFMTKEMHISRMEIEIPKDYKIYYLPPEYKHQSKIVSYDATFRKNSPNFFQKLFGKSSKLVFNDKYVRKLPKASSDEYSDYKACIETLAKLAKELIVLEKK